MLFPLRLSGVAVGTLLSLAGNCNSVGHGSRTEVSDSTLIAGKSGLAWVLADENAATVRTAPSEEGTAFEMWYAFTYHNTVRPAISLKEFHGFS
jgi:hypothetical protein